MTTYRVGQAGATVFDEHGHALLTLRPGLVVVANVETPELSRTRVLDGKRVTAYADKAVHVAEDKGS